MRLAAICAFSALGLAYAGNVAADSKELKGEYGFTGSADCLVSSVGFDPQFRSLDGPNTGALSFAVEGIRTFDGNGGGTVKGTSFGIRPRPTLNMASPPSAGTAEFSFRFTYTVDGEGGWTSAMVPGTYTSSHVTGPRTGQTSTADVIPPVVGMISKDGKTLIAAHTTPAVETHTYSNGDVERRVCHRSRVFISIDN